MPVISNNVDWSVTAAWIALVVSILVPYITARANNKHQLKLFKLKSESDRLDKVNDARISVLRSFISNTGRYLSCSSIDNLSDLGFSYFAAYQYIPGEYWKKLDKLYEDMIYNRWDDARELFLQLNRVIADLLKEPLQ